MQSAFTPIFEKLRIESPERAGKFFVDLSASLSVLLSVIIVAGIMICGGCLYFDLASEENSQIIIYTSIMLPSLFFICLYGLNAAFLQCSQNFFVPSVSPVFFNLIWIATAFLLTNTPIDEAMSTLSIFIIVACACQWGVTVPSTVRALRKYGNGQLRLKAQFFSSDVKELIPFFFMAVIGVSASQINNALDVIFARYASVEGPAFLWYAIRIQQLPLALFGIAIAGALLPPLTRALKNNDVCQFRHYMAFALRRSFALMLPMTAGLFLLGSASVQLLYGHGDFLQESVDGTTSCLWGYGAGLIPMTLVLILAPAFYAQEKFRFPTLASITSLGINVALNFWFVVGLKLDASSVAWSTSISSIANMLILCYALRIHLPYILNREFFLSIVKTTLVTSMALCVCLAAAPYIPEPSLAYIVIQTTLFSAVFFSGAKLLDAKDALLLGAT